MWLYCADIQLITDFAKKNKILVACDNTWSTPVFTRPLSMGADFVMHSTTKYFGGHSDIIGGCVVVEKGSELAVKIREFQTIGGAVISIPYTIIQEDDKGKKSTVIEYAHFLPENLNITGTLTPEKRYRGI